jgi:hypothetical protein
MVNQKTNNPADSGCSSIDLGGTAHLGRPVAQIDGHGSSIPAGY